MNPETKKTPEVVMEKISPTQEARQAKLEAIRRDLARWVSVTT